MSREPVTPAEEAVVTSMFGGLIVCAVVGYIVLRLLGDWTTMNAIVVSIGSFTIAGYVLPRIVAWWFGRSLDDIFTSAN